MMRFLSVMPFPVFDKMREGFCSSLRGSGKVAVSDARGHAIVD